MALNLPALVQRAIATAKKAGVAGTLTIVRPAGTVVDPLTFVASGAQLSMLVTGVALGLRELRGRSATWLEARVVVMIAAADCTFTPAMFDNATWAGVTGKITAVNAIVPAGTVLAYELAVGA